MRLLIISCRAGLGHIRAAQALTAYAQEHYADIEVRHIDLTDYVTPVIKNLIPEGYQFLVRRTPALFGIFQHTSNTQFGRIMHRVTNTLLWPFTAPLRKFVTEYAPDHIVATHPIIAQLILLAPSTTLHAVVTDYALHEWWIDRRISHYFVAHTALQHQLHRRNLPAIASGIPVHPNITRSFDQSAFISAHQLASGAKTVLVLAGGTGLADTSDLVTQIFAYPHPLNIIAVAGKNTQLFTNLKNLSAPTQHHYIPLGYTNEMNKWLGVADVVVTKPGGLTISECLALHIPMLLYQGVPGLESANARFVAENNLGVQIKKSDNIVELLEKILSTPHPQTTPTQSACNIILNTIF